MLKRMLLVLAVGSIFNLPLLASVSLAQDAAAQKALWDKHCKKCHSEDGTGMKDGKWLPVAKTLKLGEGNEKLLNVVSREEAKKWDVASIKKAILEGKDKMKPMKEKLTDAEAQQLAEYNKSLIK